MKNAVIVLVVIGVLLTGATSCSILSMKNTASGAGAVASIQSQMELTTVQSAVMSYISDNHTVPADTDALARYLTKPLLGTYAIDATGMVTQLTYDGQPITPATTAE